MINMGPETFIPIEIPILNTSIYISTTVKIRKYTIFLFLKANFRTFHKKLCIEDIHYRGVI